MHLKIRQERDDNRLKINLQLQTHLRDQNKNFSKNRKTIEVS